MVLYSWKVTRSYGLLEELSRMSEMWLLVVTGLTALLIGMIGQELLWEKRMVPPLAFIMAFVMGAYLGVGVRPLAHSEEVIMVCFLVIAVMIALHMAMTLVGIAVLSIVAGFYQGHSIISHVGYVDQPYLMIWAMTFVNIALIGLSIAIVEWASKAITIQWIGVISALGALILILWRLL